MVIRPVKSSYYVFESTILSFFHHFDENVFEYSISINVHIRNIRKLRRRSFRHVGRDYHQGSWDPHTSHSVIDSKYICNELILQFITQIGITQIDTRERDITQGGISPPGIPLGRGGDTPRKIG